MARGVNRLSARFVATVKGGDRLQSYPDGGGLYLQVTPGGSRSWVLRYKLAGRERYMGLGSAATFGLAEARERAQAARKLLADGIDPLEAKAAPRAAQGRTWGEAVDDFIARTRPEWKGQAQADQWTQSLRDYGPDRAMRVADVDTEAVLACLSPIWTTKTETATRVRGRIERVWAAEKVRGSVKAENPARWKGHLAHLLARPSKVAKVRHFRAMPWADVPAFYRSLGSSKTAKALAFTILTAARTSEVTGMHMGEVRGEVWTIPAERMKAGRPHRVPLVPAAVALLPKSGKPFALSSMAMLNLLQEPAPKGRGLPFTVHGFRSSFRDWAAENGWPGDVVEMSLAHTIADKTEAAYRRGDLLERRRELMQAWAAFLGA